MKEFIYFFFLTGLNRLIRRWRAAAGWWQGPRYVCKSHSSVSCDVDRAAAEAARGRQSQKASPGRRPLWAHTKNNTSQMYYRSIRGATERAAIRRQWTWHKMMKFKRSFIFLFKKKTIPFFLKQGHSYARIWEKKNISSRSLRVSRKMTAIVWLVVMATCK